MLCWDNSDLLIVPIFFFVGIFYDLISNMFVSDHSIVKLINCFSDTDDTQTPFICGRSYEKLPETQTHR